MWHLISQIQNRGPVFCRIASPESKSEEEKVWGGRNDIWEQKEQNEEEGDLTRADERKEQRDGEMSEETP